MSSRREQLLSEFIDAWNAGRRPAVADSIARVPGEEQADLGEGLATFLTFAPTPSYSDESLAAIRAEIGDSVGTDEERGIFAALLARGRSQLGMSTAEVANELVGELGLTTQQATKTARYLERLENGSLEPARVSRRVFAALGKVLRMPGAE